MEQVHCSGEWCRLVEATEGMCSVAFVLYCKSVQAMQYSAVHCSVESGDSGSAVP